jgi:four helix bundle protein
MRSGTSVGANLEEAEAGQSRADFIAKSSIALKKLWENSYLFSVKKSLTQGSAWV